MTVSTRFSANSVFGTKLAAPLAKACAAADYDLALVAALEKRRKLYTHLGFKPFGPAVGRPPTLFQPMYMDRRSFDLLAGRTKLLR